MTLITATRFNNLQEKIEGILGNGAGKKGYGQGRGAGYGSEINSFPVSRDPDGNFSFIVSAADINAIFADMVRCRIHQIGTEPEEIAQLVANENIIALTTSNKIDNQGNVTIDPDGDKKGFEDFENLIKKIEDDRFLAAPTQMTTETAITSIRTVPWNGINTHEFTVSFRDADHRRHFFNSGGEIRFTASNNNSDTAKGQDWNAMLTGIGTIIFNYEKTVSSLGVGNALNIGNYDLTNEYKLIYKKVRSNGAVVYSGNEYYIDAKIVTDSSLRFRIRFDDASDEINNRNIDENVDGTLLSTIQILRADSSLGVTVPPPSFNNIVELSAAPEPPPPILFTFSNATFTPGGATGRLGPSLLQARNGLIGAGVNSFKNNTEFFNVTNGIQLWTVPFDGTYRIEAWGAQGGNGGGRVGGLGARMRGDFQLFEGEVIRILVGQKGTSRTGSAANSSGAGGGGSFVVRAPYNSNQSILTIAGGGGGAGSSTNGGPGQTITSGQDGFGGSSGSGGTNGGGGGAARGGSGGNAADGGAGSSCSFGAGGGGFFGNGGQNCLNFSFSGQPNPQIAGFSFISGGLGGPPSQAIVGGVRFDQPSEGGFGGGAGVGHRASGGGGYSGGGGDGTTSGGGGGGSLNNGSNQSNSAGVRSGDGQVTITVL